MPKKPVSSASKKNTAKPSVAKSTPVRNTPIPKAVKAKPAGAKIREVTPDLIAERAYFISISGNGGSQDDNWHRAERELRNGL